MDKKSRQEATKEHPNNKNLLRGGPGRPKGAITTSIRELREMILSALDKKGGIEYLANLKDADFCRLLGRVIPLQINGELNGSLSIEIIDYSKVAGEKK